MRKFYFFNYIPFRYPMVTEEEERIRDFVHGFKDGDKQVGKQVADLVVDEILSQYGSGSSNLLFVCVPASDSIKNTKRFSYFSKLVSTKLGQENAYRHIHVTGFRESKHLNADHTVHDTSCYQVVIDNHFFKGKKVILFDDLITTGMSSTLFKSRLEEAGADVISCIFLAKTTPGLPYCFKPVGFDSYIIEPVEGVSMDEFFENINQICDLIYS